MKSDIILRKLYLEKKEFVKSDYIKENCRKASIKYDNLMRHLIPRGYLVRIFKGIFYVKTPEEVRLKSIKYDPLRLVSKGMELKGVKNWYFGLTTALKLNNLTHEYFNVHEVINDKLLRTKPMDIAGAKFRFVKVKPSLFNFGIIDEDLRYSDPEKTILDFIYLWNYRGLPEKRTLTEISEYSPKLSENKLKSYLPHYPNTVKNTIEKARA